MDQGRRFSFGLISQRFVVVLVAIVGTVGLILDSALAEDDSRQCVRWLTDCNVAMTNGSASDMLRRNCGNVCAGGCGDIRKRMGSTCDDYRNQLAKLEASEAKAKAKEERAKEAQAPKSAGIQGGATAEQKAASDAAIAKASASQGYTQTQSAERAVKKGKAKSSDDCAVSDVLSDGSMTCDQTKGLVKTAQITNIVGQRMGEVAVKSYGDAQVAAASQEGGMVAGVRGARKTAERAASVETMQGTVNTALGIAQLVTAAEHEENAEKIKQEVGEANYKAAIGPVGDTDLTEGQRQGELGYVTADTDLGNKAVKNFKLNEMGKLDKVTMSGSNQNTKATHDAQVEARLRGNTAKEGHVQDAVDEIESAAVREQMNAANEANAGGLVSTITGATQLLNSEMQRQTAKELKRTERKLQDITSSPPGAQAQFNFRRDPVGNTASAPREQLIVGGRTAGADGEEGESKAPLDEDKGGGGGLGAPLPPKLADGPKEAGPAPGAFSPGGGGSGGGGGGGGGVSGGGGTTASAEGKDDNNSKMAESMKNPSAYGGVAGAVATGGGGGGGGKSGGGIDVGSILAKYLPGKEEEAQPSGGILDYGARGPAGGAPASLLDRNANLFERIHLIYQIKHRKGLVGDSLR